MERYTHVHCVCGGSEPEYTAVIGKTLFWDPGWRGGGGGGQQFFSSLQGGNRKFL